MLWPDNSQAQPLTNIYHKCMFCQVCQWGIETLSGLNALHVALDSLQEQQYLPPRPSCTCEAHLVWTRSRFGELNDRQHTDSYIKALYSVSDGQPRSCALRSRWIDCAVISCCVDSRCSRRTACVSASVMGACCLCLLTCLEPRRYSALTTCVQTRNQIPSGSGSDFSFYSLGLYLGLQFGKLQNLQTGYWAGTQEMNFEIFYNSHECKHTNPHRHSKISDATLFLYSCWKPTRSKVASRCWRWGLNSSTVMISRASRYSGPKLWFHLQVAKLETLGLTLKLLESCTN